MGRQPKTSEERTIARYLTALAMIRADRVAQGVRVPPVDGTHVLNVLREIWSGKRAERPHVPSPRTCRLCHCAISNRNVTGYCRTCFNTYGIFQMDREDAP